MFGLKKPLPRMRKIRRADEDGQRLKRHQEVADRHQHGADDDGPFVAQEAVGQIAAEHRRHVDKRRVNLVDARRFFLVVAEVVHHVQHQQGAHPVVAEAFPHFGEEEDVQADGMAKERRLFDDGRCGSLTHEVDPENGETEVQTGRL